ncbi:MAG: NHL repeat-containing protein [Planctomycetota bacterium]|jgi:DNA-binding beta-propeller fold protein YncE
MSRISGTTNTKIFIGVLIGLAVFFAVVAVVRLDTTGKKGGGLGKEFMYDITELKQIDPNLILYEESTQPIKTGFTDSHSIALDSEGTIYVAGDKAIRLLDEIGELLDEIKLTETVGCLDIADNGKIYVGMRNHVEVYDGWGKRQSTWKSLGRKAVLTSIIVWKNNVFVADAGNRIVVHYDITGTVINRIGKKDSRRNIPGFVIPSPYFDLAVPRDGLLRVVNPGRRRIEAYTFDGDLEFWWGEASAAIEGFCGCCNPVNIAVLPDDGFVTCEKGLVRVKVYDSEGEFLGVVAGPSQLARDGEYRVCDLPEECQAGGFDVAVDASGRIFVLDTINNVVRIFTKIRTE